jgi:hypothetical protein
MQVMCCICVDFVDFDWEDNRETDVDNENANDEEGMHLLIFSNNITSYYILSCNIGSKFCFVQETN